MTSAAGEVGRSSGREGCKSRSNLNVDKHLARAPTLKPNMFEHEQLYHGGAVLEKVADVHVTIVGVGAIGSNLADSLSRQGFERLRLIDFDRVEPKNLGTQIYSTEDVGMLKVDAACNAIFRNVEVEPEPVAKKLSESNIKKLLRDTDLVIDALDNSASRGLLSDFCGQTGIECLHAGLADGYGEVIWNDGYKVPDDSGLDLCDYPLARNLVQLVVTITAEEIVDFVSAESARRKNWSVTLQDLTVREM